jgi:dienelactone hydrolase
MPASRVALVGQQQLLGPGRPLRVLIEADRLSSSIDADAVNAIALAAIDRLAEGAGTRIGTVGFSFGAAWAVWTAGRREQVGASVVYYGSVTGPTKLSSESDF